MTLRRHAAPVDGRSYPPAALHTFRVIAASDNSEWRRLNALQQHGHNDAGVRLGLVREIAQSGNRQEQP